MKLKLLPSLLLSLAAILLLVSCSKKSNTLGRYVPANAAIVLHLNAATLTAKLPWEEVKQNELFKKMIADSSLSPFVKAALDNPENTGIDIKTDLIFFMVKDSTGAYVAFEGGVKDAAKFKAYNSSVMKNAKASQKNGVEYIADDKTTVSWNQTKFILVADAPEASQLNNMGRMMNKDSMMLPPAVSVSTRDEAAIAEQLYTLAENSSLAKNEKFSELVSAKGDVHFWMNAESFNPGTAGMGAMSMVNMNKIFEGSVTSGTVNFESGKIDVDVKSFAGKELTDIWKKYSGSKISNDMVKRLPAKDVAFFLAMNFKPEGIKEFVKLIGMEGLINMGAAFLGFNLDDFVKANKGDIILVVSDIVKDSLGKPGASVLFAASVGDKASFDKLVAAGNKMGKDQLGAAASQIYFNQNKTYFAIGNKKENTDQFITKDGNSTFNFYNKIASSPIGGYVNLQYIMTSMRSQASKDSLGLLAMDASIKMWENIILSGGDFKKDGITQHIEINLVDKSTNSLKQLNKYAAAIGVIAEQKKKETNITDIRLQGDTTGVKDSLKFE